MIDIRTATTDADLAAVRGLTYALIAWLQHLYPEAHDLFEQDKRAMAAAPLAEKVFVADHPSPSATPYQTILLKMVGPVIYRL